jgi:hypothetical protein
MCINTRLIYFFAITLHRCLKITAEIHHQASARQCQPEKPCRAAPRRQGRKILVVRHQWPPLPFSHFSHHPRVLSNSLACVDRRIERLKSTCEYSGSLLSIQPYQTAPPPLLSPSLGHIPSVWTTRRTSHQMAAVPRTDSWQLEACSAVIMLGSHGEARYHVLVLGKRGESCLLSGMENPTRMRFTST